ncbi:MAG: Mut7-C ubiquitin/RNAse domain-containing protein [Acidimicrobiales bacterium]|nr:Mut7-C ubiquitin/RNAse domain-containing protein [Acidimicrobiales bacterium]
MESLTFRFYGELEDFVPAADLGRDLVGAFYGVTTVKDRIESLGVPHTEVGLILVDGEAVDLGHRLEGGERVAVYPRFRRLPSPSGPPLRSPRPCPARFVADVHVATLARNLRLLGFDTRWDRNADDGELARTSAGEHRILLTRDRLLLRRSIVEHGYFVRDDDPVEQTVDVVRNLDLLPEARPFHRCLACNDVPQPVDKREIEHLLEPGTRRDHDRFNRCPGCGRLYWWGSHRDRLARLVEDITARAGPGTDRTDPLTSVGPGRIGARVRRPRR